MTAGHAELRFMHFHLSGHFENIPVGRARGNKAEKIV